MTAGFVEGEVDVGRVRGGLPGPGGLVVEARLRLHTPWWGGDYDVKTVHVARGGDGGLRPVPPYITPLTEETVKGALRWVLRAAIVSAAHKRHGVHLTLGEADEIASIILGGASRVTAKSLLNIRVDAGELEGPARASGEIAAFISEVVRILEGVVDSLLAEMHKAGIRARSPVLVRKARLAVEFVDYTYKEEIVAASRQASTGQEQSLIDFFASILNQIQTVKVKSREKRRQISMNLVRAGILPGAVKRLHGLIMQSDCYRALAATLSASYVKLHALGAVDVEDLVARLPVPPECFGNGWNVRVGVEIAEGDVVSRRGVEAHREAWDCLIEALPRIAALLLAIAPVLVGFGKGSSRGFGRWVPERIECRGEASEGLLSCGSLEEYREPYAGVGSPEGLAERLGRYMEELVEAVGPLVDYAFSAGIVRPRTGRGYPVAPGLAPRLLTSCTGGGEGEECSTAAKLLEAVASGKPVAVLIPVEVSRHPLPVHTSLLRLEAEGCEHNRRLVNAGAGWRPSSTADFINALSHATLKVTWKIACDIPIDGKGWPFHTWILGLPRQQKGIGGYELVADKSKEGRRKSPLTIIPWASGAVLAIFSTLEDHASTISNIAIKYPVIEYDPVSEKRKKKFKSVNIHNVVRGSTGPDFPSQDSCCGSGNYGLAGVALPGGYGGCVNVLLDVLRRQFPSVSLNGRGLCRCSSMVLSGGDWDVRRAAVALMLASGVLFVVGAVGGFGGCGV